LINRGGGGGGGGSANQEYNKGEKGGSNTV